MMSPQTRTILPWLVVDSFVRWTVYLLGMCVGVFVLMTSLLQLTSVMDFVIKQPHWVFDLVPLMYMLGAGTLYGLSTYGSLVLSKRLRLPWDKYVKPWDAAREARRIARRDARRPTKAA